MRRFFIIFLENFSIATCAKYTLILFFTLGTAFSQIPTNGLKGQWKLDGNVTDASGNNNNGTLQGGAVYCEDRFGKANSAVKFGGFHNSSAIHIPNSPSLHLNSELTIAYWMKLDDPGGMDDYGNYTSTGQARHAFFAKDGNRSGFAFGGGGAISSLYRVAFGIVNNTSCSGDASFALADYNCIKLEWSHLAIVVDDFSITLYINGIEKHRETYKSQITFTKANQNDLNFGRYGYNCGMGPYFWYPLNGKMDDIFYYNRALSQGEINILYNYPAVYAQPSMFTDTINDSVCLGEKYDKNGFSLPVQSQTGLYTYSRTNGCDSIWVLNLNVVNCNPVCLDLFFTGTSSANGFINLEWKWFTPPAGDYGYTLYQWDDVLKVWQSTSTDSTSKVCSAPDLAAPDIPDVNRQTGVNCNKIEIFSKDNGTPYRFYVKATNMVDNTDTCTSNILDVIITSGLKGFYILENDNATSPPVLSTSFLAAFIAAKDMQVITYSIQDLTKYTHIQAIDSAGNLGAIFTLNPIQPHKVVATVYPASGGTVTGAGTFYCETTATLTAIPEASYSFVNWTESGTAVSTNRSYSFIVTQDRTLTANFKFNSSDSLDFDTYAVIICDRVILLNLKKLAEDGYEITGCKWFKNGIEQKDTHTNSEYSYSEGANLPLEKAPNYYQFRLNTKNYGELWSTQKIIIPSAKMLFCPGTEISNILLVYPNPAMSGSMLTLEGLVPNSPVYVYNYLGECVLKQNTTHNTSIIVLDVPSGIYLIRNDKRIVKIVIVK